MLVRRLLTQSKSRNNITVIKNLFSNAEEIFLCSIEQKNTAALTNSRPTLFYPKCYVIIKLFDNSLTADKSR